MDTLSQINGTLSAELKAFNRVFREAVRSKVPLLDVIMKYILRSKGKQLRPLFVLLSARMHGEINESTYRAATLIELMHTATLVHDDVVDDSFQRRNRFSVNYLWRNKIAVLAGDYLLSRGMLLALENKEFNLLGIVSGAVRDMSEGELLQLEKARKLDISEEIYFQIIRQKTASLIASCFATGTASVTKDQDLIDNMHKIGKYAGIAFQIKDDLFDFENGNKAGKPAGIDIKEKKMTLPLIYLLSSASQSEKRRIIRIVKRYNTNEEKVGWLIHRVRESGGLDYAKRRMDEYKEKSLELLRQFPDNPGRQSMVSLIEFLVERDK
ncbi:MAG: polyprenyl synthetase family protein [bacterium]|jgi:octaprenyl-diphosphate synthase